MQLHREESGFALLLTVFVIALTTMLVMDFATQVQSFQRSTRGYVESIQAQYILKSTVTLAEVILQAPKPEETKNEDWLGDPWSNIAAAPSLPIEGFLGETRLMIVDDDGKLDINAISAGTGVPGADGSPAPDPAAYWKNALSDLMSIVGIQREQYDASSFRTLGNVGLAAAEQVATISDWIDRDSESYNNPAFNGQGSEASADKRWFFNRPLRSLGELAMVPGMTLERLQRLAPFIKVSQSLVSTGQRGVNINTAPYEVLLAMGLPQAQVDELLKERLNQPLTQKQVQEFIAADQTLAGRIKSNSTEFTVYARVKTPSRTSWAKAVVGVLGQSPRRKTVVRQIEFH